MGENERDTISALVEWGKWSCGANHVGLGAKSSMLHVMQLVRPSSSKFAAMIIDRDVLLVDAAVGALKLKSVRLYKIIVWYFVWGNGLREIATKLNCSRDRAGKEFSHACGWLECRMELGDSFLGAA